MISERGLALIKEFEGLRLKAYPDPATGGEPWTIGYGRAHGIQPGQECTQEQADAWLKEDAETASRAVLRHCVPMLTQNQLDAITSFVFNLGEGNFQNSTLLKKINAQDWAGARAEFARWNKAAGKEMPGLTRRRAEEAALFGGSEPVTQEKPVLPLLPLILPLASSLIEAFSPLAREKITKEMSRHTDKPEVAEQIASGVIETVKTLTGKSDPIEAVAQARNDPAIIAAAERGALDTLDRLVGVIERVDAMEQRGLQAARQYNTDEPLFLEFSWLKLKFIHVLSLLFVGFSGSFVWKYFDTLTAELKGAVITLMVIAGYVGVRDYWMNSSAGSALKTQLLNRISDAKKE